MAILASEWFLTGRCNIIDRQQAVELDADPMIFFTRDLYQRLQSDWQKASREWKRYAQLYANYLESIAPLLPVSVKQLCRSSLHDATMVTAHKQAGDLTLVLDTSNALSRYYGNCVHLCFRGVKKHVPLRGLAGQWWLYAEAHLCSRSRFSLHVMLDKSDLEIEADELVIELFRRQLITKVGPNDLRRYPIWQLTEGKAGIDDQNATWIRPVKRKSIPRNVRSVIVATQFTPRSGRAFHGFLVVTTTNGRVEIESGAVHWRGFRRLGFVSRKKTANDGPYCALKERKDLVCALDQKDGDVFPVHYRLNAAILGEKAPREGQII
jgi:hypothetical protein